MLTYQPKKRRWILHLIDKGSYRVEVSRTLAAAGRVVAQYPAAGWKYTAEKSSAGLWIEVDGEAEDRILVLE